MRLLVAAAVLLVTPLTFGQAGPGADKNSQAKEELRKLFVELNEAFQKRDRAALERIYADDFVWVHGSGYVVDRPAHLDDSMTIEIREPLPMPTFDDLRVYGDVAVTRSLGRSRAGALYSTAVYVRRDGRWQILQLQGTPMLPERKSVKVDSKILDAYVGKYQVDAGESLTVAREGEALVMTLRRPNVPKRRLVATSESQFFDKVGTEYNFRGGEGGAATHIDIRTPNGQERKWKRVE